MPSPTRETRSRRTTAILTTLVVASVGVAILLSGPILQRAAEWWHLGTVPKLSVELEYFGDFRGETLFRAAATLRNSGTGELRTQCDCRGGSGIVIETKELRGRWRNAGHLTSWAPCFLQCGRTPLRSGAEEVYAGWVQLNPDDVEIRATHRLARGTSEFIEIQRVVPRP